MFKALVIKEMQRIGADRRAILINLALPLLLTFIMGLSFGGMFGGNGISAIPLVLVAPDLPAAVKDRLAEALNESGYFATEWADSAAADARVRAGDAAAALLLPAGLLGAYLDGQEVEVELWQDPGSRFKSGIVEQVLERGVLRLRAGDAAYRALWPEDAAVGADDAGTDDLVAMLEGDLLDVWRRWRDPANRSRVDEAGRRFKRILDHQMALSDALSAETVTLAVDDVSDVGQAADGDDVNLFNVFLPGFAVFFLMFTVAAGARDLHREISVGTFQRQLLSPVTGPQLVLSKWAASTARGALTFAVLFLSGAVLFRVNLGPDAWSLPIVILATSAAGGGFFLLLALLTPSEKVMDSLATVVILVSAMIGGNFVPLDAMPAWLHGFGRFVFNYWANRAIQGVVAEDGGLGTVAVPLTVLGGLAVVLPGACLLVFRIRTRRGGGV